MYTNHLISIDIPSPLELDSCSRNPTACPSWPRSEVLKEATEKKQQGLKWLNYWADHSINMEYILVYMDIYIYIYMWNIYIYMCIYIWIYIYIGMWMIHIRICLGGLIIPLGDLLTYNWIELAFWSTSAWFSSSQKSGRCSVQDWDEEL